tara:strand:+ start:337 stop:708 length:372 start_codon:yes stop_codon:yes gene_type:complete
MTSTQQLVKYDYTIWQESKSTGDRKKGGKVKRTHSGDQETTCIDYGEGINENVMKAGQKIMEAKRDTRYKKILVSSSNAYWFYNCNCGWGTGNKFHKKTYLMLVRLHRKKCDGNQPECKECKE